MRNQLYYQEGNIDLLKDTSFKLGIVGSRSILSYTKNVLENLFIELKNFDFCIVSGGMYGVDIYAHNLALRNNLKTIIVLPQGISTYKDSSLYNQLYLKENSNYLMVSEYPDNFLPRKYTYLQRNKIIAELSNVLLIAQASYKSGSISTAFSAIKQNKKLVSVPFSLDTPQFQGTNLLIDKGSKIYLNPSTVLEQFNISERNIEDTIKNILFSKPHSLKDLELCSGIGSGRVQNCVLKLILDGEIFFDGEKYSL